MKGLFTTLLLIPVFWMNELPAASAEERELISRYAGPVVSDSVEVEAMIVATSWKGSGKYGYYDRWDHRRHSHPYFDRHRHGHVYPRFYGHRQGHSPYRPHPFHGGGFYHRHYRGDHFGFSACYRSGSVLVCVNESRPYRYR